MANKHKGEVELKAGDRVYTIRLGFDTLERLEELVGQSFDEAFKIFATPGKPKLKLVRMVLWAGLQDNHPELKLEDMGAVIEEAGLMNVLDAFNAANRAAFPTAEEGKAGEGGSPIPPGADDGTGRDSSAKE